MTSDLVVSLRTGRVGLPVGSKGNETRDRPSLRRDLLVLSLVTTLRGNSVGVVRVGVVSSDDSNFP